VQNLYAPVIVMDNIEVKVTEVEERAKSNSRRIDKLEDRADRSDKLYEAIATIQTKQDNMEGDVSEIKADVKKLTLKPGDEYSDLKGKILWAVIAAVIGLVLGKVGIG